MRRRRACPDGLATVNQVQITSVVIFLLLTPMISQSEPPIASIRDQANAAGPRPLLILRGGAALHTSCTPPLHSHNRARDLWAEESARRLRSHEYGSCERNLPASRYPNSYLNLAAHRASAPRQCGRTSDTPWKGANTPHYIHAKTLSSQTLDSNGLQAFGEVVTVEATAKHTASVIWLHGLGDTGHTWSAVASWLQMPWCKFIFPTAPAQPVSMKQIGYAMPSWFDFDSLDMEDVDEDAETMERSVAYLHAMIEREVRNGVPHERIMLAGFAQGGVVALVASLKCRFKIGGVLALSSWLPRNFFRRSNDLSHSAKTLPIWFYHGTDDKVVKYERGWNSYLHALDLGLQAQFKCYDGLGHEYASQEMIDAQSFFFRRIPLDAAEAVPEQEPRTFHDDTNNRRRTVLRQRITIGGAPSHFNAPWHYAISHGSLRAAGLEVVWKDYQSGTTAMTQELGKGAIDMAVLSTDGAVAEIAQGASFKIVAPFVTTPLRYGVFVFSGHGRIQSVDELEGLVFAVSRKGSLSHTMTYLHAQQAGWNPRNWDQTGSSLLEVGNLAGAVAALQEGRAQGLLWEVGSAQQLVDRGDLVMLSECSPQWPSFVLAARNDFLTSRGGATAIRDVLETMAEVCMDFEVWPGRFNLICQKYGFRTGEARRRLTGMQWSCQNVLSDEVLDEVAFTLVAVGILQQFPAVDDMFVSLDDLDDRTPSDIAKSCDIGGGSSNPPLAEESADCEAPMRTVRFEEPVMETKKEKYKQRPPTPFPWAMAGKPSEEGTAEDRRQDCQRSRVYDSSESDEPSYEPDFKKTDQGTVEITGAAAAEVREAVGHHEKRGKWLKGGTVRPNASKLASPEWKSCVQDEQISAILDKSLMISSTAAPHSTAHHDERARSSGEGTEPDRQLTGLRGSESNCLTAMAARSLPFRQSVGAAPHTSGKARAGCQPRMGARATETRQLDHLDMEPEPKMHDTSLQVGRCKWESQIPQDACRQAPDGLASKNTGLSPCQRPAWARQEDEDGQGSDVTDITDGGGDSNADFKDVVKDSGGIISLSQTAPSRHIQLQTAQTNHLDLESLASTNSASGNEPVDSERERQQKAALNLRKLRDSVAIRRTAAKFKQTGGGMAGDESPGSVSDHLAPIRPAALFVPTNADECRGANVNSCARKQASEGGQGLFDRPPVTSAPLDESSLKTQSEETSPTAGQAHSLERHPAEFRHTLRKSVRRECNTAGSLMPPTALFGGEQALGKGDLTPDDVAPDGCPICLEPTDGGQVHVTTCAHRFHRECYNDYRRNTMVKMRDQCPVCRTCQRSDHAQGFPDDPVEAPPRFHDGGLGLGHDRVDSHPRPPARDDSISVDDGHISVDVERGLSHAEPSCHDESASALAHPSMFGRHRDRRSSKPLADTPLVLESQVQHVNPVLNRHSPLTGLKKGKGSMHEPDERRGWPTQSMRRSPPWATSMNPFSTTTGRQDREHQRAASPIPVLAKMSENDVAAAVEGFAVPEDLLEWSHGRRVAESVPNQRKVYAYEHHSEGAPRTGAEHASRRGMHAAERHSELSMPSAGARNAEQKPPRGPQVAATIVSDGRRTSKMDCASMQNALELANRVGPGGSLLLARSGVHEWEGDLLVQGTWLLKETSSGTFDSLTCQHTAVDLADSCLLVWGGPWLLDACSIRSRGGTAIECCKSCAVMVRRSRVGGMDAARAAAGGLSVGGNSRCLLEKCVVEYISSSASPKRDAPHGGIHDAKAVALCAMGNGKLSFEYSTIRDCGCGVALYGRPRVIMRSSKLLTATIGAFDAQEGSQEAELLLQKTQVQSSKTQTDEHDDASFRLREADNAPLHSILDEVHTRESARQDV